MKIKVVSDLHLEFSDINIVNEQNVDVLILSGDIMIAEDLHNHPEMDHGASNINIANLGRRQATAIRFRDFLKRCSTNFPHVIYVAGNHEFYHGKWCASIDHLHNECAKFNNVYFLEDNIKVIDDVTFVGSTLWTDCNNYDPLTLYHLTNMMNDYSQIRNDSHGYTKLRPAHSAARHSQSLSYIKTVVDDRKDQKIVVVTHHAPSSRSIHERYRHDVVMNGAYHSNLEEFILARPQIKLWTHGHVHTPFDYNVGSTRVVCNPRGYENYESPTGWNPDILIEV